MQSIALTGVVNVDKSIAFPMAAIAGDTQVGRIEGKIFFSLYTGKTGWKNLEVDLNYNTSPGKPLPHIPMHKANPILHAFALYLSALVRLHGAPLMARYSALTQNYYVSETDEALQKLLLPTLHYLTNRAHAE